MNLLYGFVGRFNITDIVVNIFLGDPSMFCDLYLFDGEIKHLTYLLKGGMFFR